MTKPILGVSLLVVIAVAPVRSQEAPPPLPLPPPAQLVRFLRQSIGLDSAQLVLIERGEAVVKVLDTRDRRDVAVFGIITANAARETYVTQLRDFRTSLRTPTRSQLGVFSDPASAADVAAVTISPRDVADMKDCRPGDCIVKLPATDMRRIHDEMNWSAADLQTQLSAYARRRLVEYVTDYRARGDSAMAVYDDRGNLNVRSSEAFAGLLAESPYVYQNVPSLGRYLSSYPREKLAGAAEVLFWSEDVMPRLRPILSVTHQVVYTPPELPGVTLVAAKQIYANHYFEAAVDLTCIVDRGQGSYVLVFRRYRFDNMPSGGILNIRGRAIGALREQLLADLRRQKATAEHRAGP
jgi:hypothetical protein